MSKILNFSVVAVVRHDVLFCNLSKSKSEIPSGNILFAAVCFTVESLKSVLISFPRFREEDFSSDVRYVIAFILS